MRVDLPQYLPVEWVPRDAIHPNDWNPNEMPEKRREALAQSIEDNGWTQPIVVHAEDNYIIDGEQRWAVAEDFDDPDLTPPDVPPNYVPVFGVVVDEDHARLATVQHNRARGSISEHGAEEFLSELQELDVLDTAGDRITFNSESLNDLLAEFGETGVEDVELGEPTEPEVVDDESDEDSEGAESGAESEESEPDPTPEMTEYPSLAARNAERTRVFREVLSAEEFDIVMEALGQEERGQSLVNLLRYVEANEVESDAF